MNTRKTLMGSVICLFSVCISLASCEKFRGPQIEGTWTQPIPGMPERVQGFVLNKDGKAESVNMATLRYNTWKVLGYDSLVLTGTSIGNGGSYHFTDTLIIESLTDDSLHLKRGVMIEKFARTKE